MKKEKLLLSNIKADVKYTLKNSYIGIIWLSLLCIALAAICLWVKPAMRQSFFIFLYFLVFVLMLLLMIWILVSQILYIATLHRALRDTKNIVKDKLIGMEIEDHYSRSLGMYKTYHLHFSSYGKYIVPDENYKWSSMYNMRDNGVYRYSECGDEFYLVLSKKHTGKILLAYNTKMFELE